MFVAAGFLIVALKWPVCDCLTHTLCESNHIRLDMCLCDGVLIEVDYTMQTVVTPCKNQSLLRYSALTG